VDSNAVSGRLRVFDRVHGFRVLWAVIIYQQPFEELSPVGAIPLDIEAGPHYSQAASRIDFHSDWAIRAFTPGLIAGLSLCFHGMG
jgi:hypothetical protein